jgi:uncharacterized DUF497 family protein
VDIIWDEQKSGKLKKERGISLDEVAALILAKTYVDVVKHPKRPGQMMFVIPISGYIHVVPFVVDRDGNIVLKTVFPSRTFHKRYGGEKP